MAQIMKKKRPRDLPDFNKPPLNELVLSIQFSTTGFRAIHGGLLWQEFEARYPRVEEYLAIDPVFETFGMAQAASIQPPNMQLLSGVGPVRYWFMSPSGNEILQVQADRIIHNWRELDAPETYPRYEPLREKFRSEAFSVGSFFRERNLGEIACNQCEVSYINIIPIEDKGFSDTFSFWNELKLFNGSVERANVNFSYELHNPEFTSEPVGRLHVNITTAIRRRDSSPVWRMMLTARGKPQTESIEAAFEWLDFGRAAIVKSFADLTTTAMHESWERIYG